MSVVVHRFLRKVVRQWREARKDKSLPWPNRCLTCEKPLLCPLVKYTHCTNCWHDVKFEEWCKENGYCFKCSSEFQDEIPEHQCELHDCPFISPYDKPSCGCPSEEEQEEEWNPTCRQCGKKVEGSDYEFYRLCSRHCMRMYERGR
jgi:hypothetical protein